MTIELESVAFCSENPQSDAEFWGAVLDRQPERDRGELLLAGSSEQLSLRFALAARHREERNRLHLHLADGPRSQRDTIAQCVRLGARLRGSGHVPENSYAAMADVVGDEFCVIADGNPYLAGCGPLGEVACEGTRTVGLFWSRALGWPLVWEEGEQTAIQSPAGGTKVAWGGGNVKPETARDRQYFVLTARSHQLDDEVKRLVGLGAKRDAISGPGEIRLRDPDGCAFVVRERSA
jgi:hypothetical protein